MFGVVTCDREIHACRKNAGLKSFFLTSVLGLGARGRRTTDWLSFVAPKCVGESRPQEVCIVVALITLQRSIRRRIKKAPSCVYILMNLITGKQNFTSVACELSDTITTSQKTQHRTPFLSPTTTYHSPAHICAPRLLHDSIADDDEDWESIQRNTDEVDIALAVGVSRDSYLWEAVCIALQAGTHTARVDVVVVTATKAKAWQRLGAIIRSKHTQVPKSDNSDVSLTKCLLTGRRRARSGRRSRRMCSVQL